MDLPVRTDILCAINLPPITASPVHKECPNVPPIVTPATFCKEITQSNFQTLYFTKVKAIHLDMIWSYSDLKISHLQGLSNTETVS